MEGVEDQVQRTSSDGKGEEHTLRNLEDGRVQEKGGVMHIRHIIKK